MLEKIKVSVYNNKNISLTDKESKKRLGARKWKSP